MYINDKRFFFFERFCFEAWDFVAEALAGLLLR